jgi:hypothetical protein
MQKLQKPKGNLVTMVVEAGDAVWDFAGHYLANTVLETYNLQKIWLLNALIAKFVINFMFTNSQTLHVCELLLLVPNI